MIPKIIHYCWFGRKPLPKSALKCISSWKKYFPDYEIKEWNEDNFDINITQYTCDAYNSRKYAFVSDYARIWILYNYGGIYFDTDVEVIAPIDDIIANGAFMGFEINAGENRPKAVATGLGIGASKNNIIYAEILDIYKSLDFRIHNDNINPYAIVRITTDILTAHGLNDTIGIQSIEGISIYPADYFNPLDSLTGKLKLSPNTRTIHWYDYSWSSPAMRLKKRIGKFIRKLIN